MVKNPLADAGDIGLIPGAGQFSGEGDGYPLQYSCLEKSHGQEPSGLQSMWLQKSQTQLSD